MSLLSLLIALAAEKSLSSSFWRFDYYYQKYTCLFPPNPSGASSKWSVLRYTIFLLLPVALAYGILFLIGDGLLHFIISTVVLIICFGCFTTRHSYKQYLQAAFRDEKTTSDLFHQQLLQDKNLPPLGFGQALIWLNYRYYIAIMLFFIAFGAVGVIFYRLLTTVIEQQNGCSLLRQNEKATPENQKEIPKELIKEEQTVNTNGESNIHSVPSGCKSYLNILFYLDWLPVRITSFGYMFVGHFTNALPVWLESLFDGTKPTHEILIDVAQKSEDMMIDKDDCTSEPCLLVRLSKRNLLLLLASIAILTLFGITQ